MLVLQVIQYKSATQGTLNSCTIAGS